MKANYFNIYMFHIMATGATSISVFMKNMDDIGHIEVVQFLKWREGIYPYDY